jgi:hypothetical protein
MMASESRQRGGPARAVNLEGGPLGRTDDSDLENGRLRLGNPGPMSAGPASPRAGRRGAAAGRALTAVRVGAGPGRPLAGRAQLRAGQGHRRPGAASESLSGLSGSPVLRRGRGRPRAGWPRHVSSGRVGPPRPAPLHRPQTMPPHTPSQRAPALPPRLSQTVRGRPRCLGGVPPTAVEEGEAARARAGAAEAPPRDCGPVRVTVRSPRDRAVTCGGPSPSRLLFSWLGLAQGRLFPGPGLGPDQGPGPGSESVHASAF